MNRTNLIIDIRCTEAKLEIADMTAKAIEKVTGKKSAGRKPINFPDAARNRLESMAGSGSAAARQFQQPPTGANLFGIFGGFLGAA